MPYFVEEQNRVGDWITRSDLTIWLHTAAPTDADSDNGRTTVGGGAYEAGATLAASNLTAASNGDVSNSAAVAMGAADEDVGTVTHWSAVRGSEAVAYGALPAEVEITNGDTYTFPVGAIQFNISSS